MRKQWLCTTLLALLLPLSLAVYLPQLQLCSSIQFLNRQLRKYGPQIQKTLDSQKIPDIPFDDKFEGVHVQFNLTNITQKFGINWNANVINVQNENTFILQSKNINATINGHLEFKIGLTPKQKGDLVIQIEKMEADTTLAFTQPHCGQTSRGIGFDLQIEKIFVNTEKLTIKIEGKGIDNLVIRAVMAVLKSRLPSIIQKLALEKGNPAITKLTCSPIQQLFPLGTQSYIAIINTTNIPHFIKGELFAALDVTFVNAVTNATNNEIENDNLPQIDHFNGKTELTVLASSNMVNSVLWLVDDSHVLSINITNDKLGPNPPIELNTLNLSILIPSLIQYGRKQVILLVETANRFSHLYIRNGKLVAALSLSIQFVVNKTGQGEPIKQCIASGHCVVACNLNATLPLSAAVEVQQNFLTGLLHTLSIEQLKTISSQVQVKTEPLRKILNTMIGSFRPQINQQIQGGMPIDISKLEKFEIEEVVMSVRKDYAALGLVFKK